MASFSVDHDAPHGRRRDPHAPIETRAVRAAWAMSKLSSRRSCLYARELWFCSPPPPPLDSATRQSPSVCSTKRRAQQTVFGSGIDADITSTVQARRSMPDLTSPVSNRNHYWCRRPPLQAFRVALRRLFRCRKSFLVYRGRLSGVRVAFGRPLRGRFTTQPHATPYGFLLPYSGKLVVPLRPQDGRLAPIHSTDFRNFLERWGVTNAVS
ncbi:hypothetical protein GWK47_002103 [Chionoecetes opilio]|uniref:Uncharacterized protein n=1 Tax=Chionoecetes opilio TaxID=41210 RepID=A0A8J4XVB3_CHIOP|nr:hypothetical protein GWK47_002103 [Chionoecetes opilio]